MLKPGLWLSEAQSPARVPAVEAALAAPRQSRVSLTPGSGPPAYWSRGVSGQGAAARSICGGRAEAAQLCPTPAPASPPQQGPPAGRQPRFEG